MVTVRVLAFALFCPFLVWAATPRLSEAERVESRDAWKELKQSLVESPASL